MEVRKEKSKNKQAQGAKKKFKYRRGRLHLLLVKPIRVQQMSGDLITLDASCSVPQWSTDVCSNGVKDY